ncbi:MAG: efflux RND transporter periplasmic adaptor subunit [Candidatus Babeliales bacterium]
MLTKKQILILISFIAIIVTGSLYFFRKKYKETTPLLKTEKPQRKNLTQYVHSSGTLKAKEQITIGSLEAGTVIDILADNNDKIKKDQVLAIIDNGIGDSNVKLLQARLNQHKAELWYQEKFFARQKQLYESGQISKNSFEEYTKNLEVVKEAVKLTTAELEVQEKKYNNLFIKSPDNGIVIAKEIDLGQMITSQFQATVLFVMAKDLTKMETSVDVSEADVGMVKEGQKAIFKVDAFPKEIFKAKVEEIRYLAKIVENVVTYATILNINNPDLKLRPGMTTDVKIKVAKCKNGLVVQNKSLRINGSSLEQVAKKMNLKFERLPDTDAKTEIDHIWVLENKDTIKQLKITTGVRQGPYTQIIGDVTDETDIITEVTDFQRDNLLLKEVFAGASGGIGKK